MPSHRQPIRRQEILKSRLDQLVETFDFSTITPDPLEVVLRYDDPEDQEVVALIAAAFAYGRADIVVRNVSGVVEKMAPSPAAYLREHFAPAAAARRFRGFSHRFHKTPELVEFLAAISRALRAHGSLGALFQSVYDANEADIGGSLTRFAAKLIGPDASKALRYLVTSPADGSACKRMNLFLRWVVRRESPDLGIWTFVDPAKLVIPLDTHIHRISTFLALGRRKSADWKAARLITDKLARLDPADPVRYDFAICRLGILDLCSRKRRKENCDVCLLRDVCRFPVP